MTARAAKAGTAAPGGKLPTITILAFAGAALPTTGLLLALGVYLPRFYAGHIGLSLIAVGLAFTSVRLIDILFDPIIGAVMDRTTTGFGRYRPWMVIGAPVLMGSIYMLFNPPAAAGQGYLIFWLLVLYAGVSILVLAHAAWGAALASDYHERSRIYGWMHAVGVAGSVVLLLLPKLSGGAIDPGRGQSMGAVGWVLIAATPISILLAILIAPEKMSVDSTRERFGLKDYWDMIARPSMRRLILADLALALGPGTTTAIYIFFFHDAKGFSVAATSLLLIPYIGAGIIGAPAWARIAQKYGKHRTLMGATICYAVAQSALMAVPKGLLIPTAVGMFCVGFVASAFILLVRAMVADVADEVRLEQGKERLGLLYAMVTSTQKVGTAISVGIIFPILAAVGYNASDSAVNTEQAIFGLEMCYLFAPIVFVLVGGACFFGYGLNAERHAEIRRALDIRDAQGMESSIVEQVTGSQTLPDIAVEPKRG
ncbi:MFS transporter [Phenylobacterium sp.]|uniref:MFS transporter n=1 Tax=Phenylobacterium sp. TaxID=1871053 RepID=UPI0035B3FE75